MQFDQPISTNSAQKTKDVGFELVQHVLKQKRGEGASILCLYGELGSGKTTFAQGFAQGLGITQRLLSPTFIIVRRYSFSKENRNFYHLDLFRLETSDELEELGIPEIFSDSGSFMLIEWAEKLGEFLPKHRIDVRFSVEEDGSHTIEVTHG